MRIFTNLQVTCLVQPPITAGAAVDAAAASAIAVYVEATAPGSSGKRPLFARLFSESRRLRRVRVFSEARDASLSDVFGKNEDGVFRSYASFTAKNAIV